MENKKVLVKDIQFCQELMDRLVLQVKGLNENNRWSNGHTVIQNDIRRLRRELNDLNHKLDWDYKSN